MMFGTYERLNVHVYASNLGVIREARKKLLNPRNPEEREARKKFYRMMLDYHEQARNLVEEFRL
jgi:hypothetical protein